MTLNDFNEFVIKCRQVQEINHVTSEIHSKYDVVSNVIIHTDHGTVSFNMSDELDKSKINFKKEVNDFMNVYIDLVTKGCEFFILSPFESTINEIMETFDILIKDGYKPIYETPIQWSTIRLNKAMNGCTILKK